MLIESQESFRQVRPIPRITLAVGYSDDALAKVSKTFDTLMHVVLPLGSRDEIRVANDEIAVHSILVNEWTDPEFSEWIRRFCRANGIKYLDPKAMFC